MRRYTGVLLNEIAVITSGSTVYLYVSKYVDLFYPRLEKGHGQTGYHRFLPTRFYTAIKNVMPLGDPRIQEVNGIFLT